MEGNSQRPWKSLSQQPKHLNCFVFASLDGIVVVAGKMRWSMDGCGSKEKKKKKKKEKKSRFTKFTDLLSYLENNNNFGGIPGSMHFIHLILAL